MQNELQSSLAIRISDLIITKRRDAYVCVLYPIVVHNMMYTAVLLSFIETLKPGGRGGSRNIEWGCAALFPKPLSYL